MSEIEQALEQAKEAVARLMEHCETARVFLTLHDGESGTTRHVSYGAGNWYAQEGQIREWVMQNEERARSEAHEQDE